jgi:CubicO group peptidase (beta-lactamase class C family)
MPPSGRFSRSGLQRISQVLRREVDRGTAPGVVAMVGDCDGPVWSDALGWQDPARGRPMAHDTVFRLYSMTKPVVSVAAMCLVEEGRLLLADPVAKYIPAFSRTQVLVQQGERQARVAPSRPLTVQDLLRHTSGLSHGLFGAEPVRGLYAAAEPTRRSRTSEEVVDALAALPLACHPGTEWVYGASTDVLGRVIEVIESHALGTVLREKIFEPLGMRDTGFSVDRHHAAHRLAEPFARDPWTGAEVDCFDTAQPPAFESGAAGLLSTVADYARFAQMVLAGGTVDGGRILGRATLALMTADHLGPEVLIRSDLLPPGYGFGLGWAVRRQDGIAPFPGSAGQFFWGGAAGTQFWVDPAEKFWALLMVQAPGQRDHFRSLIRNLVYAALED